MSGLVRAAREESDKHHQVGQSKQPLFGLDTSSFCRTGDHAQMTAAREVVQVIDANTGQASNFGVRKDFLARFDSNQWGLANLRRVRLRLLLVRCCSQDRRCKHSLQ